MNDIGSTVAIDPIQPVPHYPSKTKASKPKNFSAKPVYKPSQQYQQQHQPSSIAADYKPSSSYYASRLDTSPIIHTLHSEWVDSPNSSVDNSPLSSPISHNIPRQSPSGKMSVTVTQDKYETPIKVKPGTYITPVSDNRINSIKMDEKSLSRSSSVSPLNDKGSKPSDMVETGKKILKNSVKLMDIFWSMLNSITGKDKMAKVGQYLLRLLIYHANKTRDYLSDESINIGVINGRYNDKSKQFHLLRNFIKHPFDFARIVVILLCSRFSSRLNGVVGGLSMYRQFLRFGKTPFRLRDLYYKINDSIDASIKNQAFDSSLFDRKTLGEVIGLYYGFNDECLLLYKLGVLSNPTFKTFVGRHESLAWYYDSILGIYNALENINKLSQEEMELKIQIQVKHKAKKLSKQILNLKSSPDNSSLIDYLNENSSSNKSDIKALQDIQFKKFNANLDLYKWLSDFIFDSYTVFNLKLPFNTLQIWFGLIASSLSTYKIFRETKKKLAEKF